jgi:hypothetical protein
MFEVRSSEHGLGVSSAFGVGHTHESMNYGEMSIANERHRSIKGMRSAMIDCCNHSPSQDIM